MRLLLRKPVETLGEPGDEVVVRPGYARNYLLPRGIALPVTEENRREVSDAKRAWAVQKVADRKAAEALGAELEGLALRFERRVKSDSDELYGSVSVLDISRRLDERGFEIARNRIILGGPIRNLGEGSVVIRLHPEVQVTLPIEVTALAVESLGDRAAVLTPEEPAAPAAESAADPAPPEDASPDAAESSPDAAESSPDAAGGAAPASDAPAASAG